VKVNATVEAFIAAFYSWDAARLTALMADDADTAAILYYQDWAEAANYQVTRRHPIEVDGEDVVCAVTVSDDFGSALGYEATDTFRLSLAGDRVSAVSFSGDDPPIFRELFRWISENRADIMTGPCRDMFAGGRTPGACARAVASAAREFMEVR
jgi:hypothetical protein